MRRIVYEQLASLMCMKTSQNTNTDYVEVDAADVDMPSNAKHLDQISSTAAATAAEASPIERLLASVHDVMETKLRSDTLLRRQTDRNQQMMNEWMIVATVIDRLCFIVFSVTLVICSLVFALLLFFHAA